MKRLKIGVAAVICAVVLILAACSNNVKTAPSPSAMSSSSPSVSSAHPSPTPKPPPSASPEITYSVKTDYSQLTPYEPMEEIYTRLSEDYMPELVPSDDYGMLVPYVGERIYSQVWWDFEYYGLMTTNGLIITDAIYSGIYSLGEENPYYILFKPEETRFPEESGYALCTHDGSWVTPFNYVKIVFCDRVILLIRDAERNDIDVMNYSGDIIYNTKNIEDFQQLAPYSFYDPHNEEGLPHCIIGDGIVAVIDGEPGGDSGGGFFFEESTGRIIQPDFTEIKGFNQGLAPVEKDGLWGYIDNGFKFKIIPQFMGAESFYKGKAVVKLQSGNYAVIDCKGIVLFESKEYPYQYLNYFIVEDYAIKETTIYNESFQEVFSTRGPDSKHYFFFNEDIGYSYVKNNTTTVCYKDSAVSMPGIYTEVWMEKDFIYWGNDELDKFKITTLDGKKSYDLRRSYYNISSIQTSQGNNYMILNIFDDYNDDYASEYNCIVLDENCNEVMHGAEYITFNKYIDCFEIHARDYFAYMDTSGKYVFRISLLDSIPD